MLYKPAKLDAVVRFVGGGTPSKQDSSFWNGSIPWVSPKDMKSFYISGSVDSITDTGLRDSACNLIPTGSVLTVVRSGVLIHTLPVALTTVPCALNQDMKAMIPSALLRSPFLAYWLLSKEQHILTTCVKKGATVQSIAMENLRSLEIPLPPLPEQDRIVEILDQADTLRQQRRQADALSQRILPALFYEMFGDPNRNEREWPTLPLDEAFDDVSRKGNKIPRSEYLTAGKIPVIDQGQDAIAGYWDEVGDAYRGKLPVTLFGDHTRIFKLLEHPFCIGADGVRLLRPKTMDCHFAFGLLTLLDVPRRGYSRHFKELRSLTYIDPPQALQERFGNAVAELRQLTAKAATSAATLETLFQTLLHRAFDGSLTAKWREGQGKELLQEMEHHSKR